MAFTRSQLVEKVRRLRLFDLQEYEYYASDTDTQPLVKSILPHVRKQAAVLIPLCIKDNDVHVFLTARSNAVGSHKGEVSFPGGSRDPPDSNPLETALRESHEEISLPPGDVELICRLAPGLTRHDYLVYPMVGLISTYFKPEPNEEVAKVFSLPLSRFLSCTDMVYLDGTECDFGFPVVKNQIDGSRAPPVVAGVHMFNDIVDGEIFCTFGYTAALCVLTATLFNGSLPSFPVVIGSSLLQLVTKENLRDCVRRSLTDTSNRKGLMNPSAPKL